MLVGLCLHSYMVNSEGLCTYLNSLMKQKATYQERKTNSRKQVMPFFTKALSHSTSVRLKK